MFCRWIKNKDLILLLVVFLSFFSTLSPLYAKGQQEDLFTEVDRLMEQKNYDDAIALLVKIARGDSSLFDKAQRRLQSIVRSSNSYTDIATQLLDAVEQEPDNSERIFELSEALSNLGEARTREAREFIRQVQEVARYAVFRNQIENILVSGRELIDAGRYAEAYNLYLTGLPLYENIFAASDYADSVKSSVSATQETIRGASAAFARLSQRIMLIAEEINAATAVLSADSRAQLLFVTQTLSRIRGELNDLVQTKALLWDVRDDYRRYGAIESTHEGRYYIMFGNLLINGRADQDNKEGLVGAINGLWQSVISPLETLASIAADGAFQDILNAANSKNYAQVRALIAETETVLRGPIDMLALYSQFSMRDDFEEQTIFGRRVQTVNLSYYAQIESLNRILSPLAQVMDYAERGNAAENEMVASTTFAEYRAQQISARQAVQRETDTRRSIAEIEQGLRSLFVSFEQYRDELFLLSAAYKGAARGSSFFLSSISFMNSINLSTIKVASATRQYGIENEEYARNYPERLARFNAGSAMVAGVSKTLNSADSENYLSKDPLQASREFDALAGSLSADIAEGRALLGRYDADDAVVINTLELANLRTAAANHLARYEALYTQGLALAAESRRAVAAAEALRTEAARFYQNSTDALARNEFDTANDYLGRSDAQYGASLAIQDSDALRTETGTRSSTLSTEIMRQREAYVRREVSGLIARAQPEFYANNHEVAEQLLIRAENLYATISDEENSDIRYWLIIVRNALSLRSGRTIPFTAPLYPEMSQLLSSAAIEYADGMALLNTHRPRALEYFSGVRQKTQEVKLLFPLNQEANLLELRMDQVIDPVAFNTSFQERLNSAISGTKNADLQAFADLQDLATLNPNYRGISQIVYQAEVDMGIRPPPPDEVAIARSRDLTRSAQNLIAGGVRANLEVAQQQLTEALRVNPDNAAAVAELDRVERLMGRRAASELESAVDTDYQEALRELLAGNKLIAYSIVRRVLSRPEYRNSGRFQELLQRIESVL
jgi:hypothetical protein